MLSLWLCVQNFHQGHRVTERFWLATNHYIRWRWLQLVLPVALPHCTASEHRAREGADLTTARCAFPRRVQTRLLPISSETLPLPALFPYKLLTSSTQSIPRRCASIASGWQALHTCAVQGQPSTATVQQASRTTSACPANGEWPCEAGQRLRLVVIPVGRVIGNRELGWAWQRRQHWKVVTARSFTRFRFWRVFTVVRPQRPEYCCCLFHTFVYHSRPSKCVWYCLDSNLRSAEKHSILGRRGNIELFQLFMTLLITILCTITVTYYRHNMYVALKELQ